MLIKRSILPQVQAHLLKREITLITGARQAGKTTVMRVLQDELVKKGGKTIFLNLDIEQEAIYFKTQSDLIKKIELELGKDKGYVFIDEIQRKENAGLFLKGIYDMELPYKFIVSGSGSLELKEKIHESLMGRKQIFEMNTLSFSEFVNYKTGGAYEKKLYDFFQIEKNKTKNLLNEYLQFGGYPKVVLEDNIEEKSKILGEIYQSFLEKDIYFLLKVEKTESFSLLAKLIASQIGRLTKISELSSTLKIARQTVEKYLWFMEKTYLLEKIYPFHLKIRKEIVKAPTYYYKDIGLRNYILQFILNVQDEKNASFLFQNYCFLELKNNLKNKAMKINFWRTKDNSEVDFVINIAGNPVPVEIKFSGLEKDNLSRSFLSFINKYQPDKAYIVNLGFEKTRKVGKTEIAFIPFYKIQEVFI